MSPEEFQKFKAEFQTDATAVAKAMADFAEKWGKREDEARSLTPEQTREMEAVAGVIDEALEVLG